MSDCMEHTVLEYDNPSTGPMILCKVGDGNFISIRDYHKLETRTEELESRMASKNDVIASLQLLNDALEKELIEVKRERDLMEHKMIIYRDTAQMMAESNTNLRSKIREAMG